MSIGRRLLVAFGASGLPSRSARSLCYRCGSRIETVVTVVMCCHVTYAEHE
jgi:hypothetical protein